MLISLDPGVRMAGVAVFEDDELSSAWLATGSSCETTAFSAFCEIEQRYPREVWESAHLAIEIPRVYTQNKLIGDPNDLVAVAFMAGLFAGFMGHSVLVCTYYPHQWKGQVPKSIMTMRIEDSLSDDEHKRVELPKAKSYRHNVWDAVGIGLYHLRRKRKTWKKI
jgi:hypothetical protein